MNNFFRTIANYTELEFINMYKSFGFIIESKILDDYQKMRLNFLSWWLSLDLNIQQKIFQFYKNSR